MSGTPERTGSLITRKIKAGLNHALAKDGVGPEYSAPRIPWGIGKVASKILADRKAWSGGGRVGMVVGGGLAAAGLAVLSLATAGAVPLALAGGALIGGITSAALPFGIKVGVAAAVALPYYALSGLNRLGESIWAGHQNRRALRRSQRTNPKPR